MQRLRSVLRMWTIFLACAHSFAQAEIKVVASTTDLAEFVLAVGKEKVSVDFIVRGTQNPHYIEIKPSFMMKLKSADVFFVIGMRFELWSQQIIDGSRNAHLVVADCSADIVKLEVPTGRTDASQGDVHPFGNPHYWLDPENIPVILQTIVRTLSAISPEDAGYFKANAAAYAAVIGEHLRDWKRRMKAYEGREIVTYHTTFTYFVRRFGIAVAGYVEPKPGIPPTPVHVTELIALMRKHRISVIGLEQYFEENVPNAISHAVDGTVARLVTSVGGREGVDSYIAVMDHNISELENAFRTF